MEIITLTLNSGKRIRLTEQEFEELRIRLSAFDESMLVEITEEEQIERQRRRINDLYLQVNNDAELVPNKEQEESG